MARAPLMQREIHFATPTSNGVGGRSASVMRETSTPDQEVQLA